MPDRPEDLQAKFCATLVDEWVLGGLRHAVVAPGSRSTPLLLALDAHPGLVLHVVHDERAAGFRALGIGLASRTPALVLTTSGTAAAELHPAVVEADLAGVPMVVCTADRPAELQDVGAAQTVDQSHLFGRATRWFHAPGVADAAARGSWRPLAARALAESNGPPAGPVHLNLAFREPLVGDAGELPEPRPDDDGTVRPWVRRQPSHQADDGGVPLRSLAGRRGVLVAGAGSGSAAAVVQVVEALGWPVLAAPQAPVWQRRGAPVVPHPDAILRVPIAAEALRPEVIVRLGGPLASKVATEWLADSGARDVLAAGVGRWTDPHGTATEVLDVDPERLLTAWRHELEQHPGAVTAVDGGAWLDRWRSVGAAAAIAVAERLAIEEELSGPGVARALVAGLPDGADLVVSSSMPVREVEWFAPPGAGIQVLANRGANGIDGVLATALGVAVAGNVGTSAALVGDLAFLHDVGSLVPARIAFSAMGHHRNLAVPNLVVVVVDNDGGGIFSFLPQAQALEAERFEALYGTPHGLDLEAVASGFGVPARVVEHDLPAAVHAAVVAGGVQVLVVRTDRAANVALHDALHEAVATSITPLLG